MENKVQEMSVASVSGCAEKGEGAIVPHMKILVIEDDLEAAAYMTKAFREAGIVADHASCLLYTSPSPRD